MNTTVEDYFVIDYVQHNNHIRIKITQLFILSQHHAWAHCSFANFLWLYKKVPSAARRLTHDGAVEAVDADGCLATTALSVDNDITTTIIQ